MGQVIQKYSLHAESKRKTKSSFSSNQHRKLCLAAQCLMNKLHRTNASFTLGHDIDVYAQRCAYFKARELRGKYGYTEHDIEDLEQSLLVRLLEQQHHYKPERGKWSTFCNNVFANHVANKISERFAQKRNHNTCNISIDTIGYNSDPYYESPADTDFSFHYVVQIPDAKMSRNPLDLDVSLWMNGLSPELRDTVRLLLGGQRTTPDGVNREAWRARLEALRRSAMEAGLTEYVAISKWRVPSLLEANTVKPMNPSGTPFGAAFSERIKRLGLLD